MAKAKEAYIHCKKIEPSSWKGDKVTGYWGYDCLTKHIKSFPCEDYVTGESAKCFNRINVNEHEDIPIPKRRESVKNLCKQVAKIPDLKVLIKDTEKKNIEHGFEICESPQFPGSLNSGKYCSGDACSMKIEDCMGGTMKGRVHSHPNPDKHGSGYHMIYSKKDLDSALREGEKFECIVYPDVPPNDDKWRLRCTNVDDSRGEVVKLIETIEEYNKNPTLQQLKVNIKKHNNLIRKGVMCEIKLG